jgi:hypothetical protein
VTAAFKAVNEKGFFKLVETGCKKKVLASY